MRIKLNIPLNTEEIAFATKGICNIKIIITHIEILI